MKLLREAIEKRGEIINDSILKVDSFLNHQIDCALMEQIGIEFANYFKDKHCTKIVTICRFENEPACYLFEKK